jgi:hypothetical protein
MILGAACSRLKLSATHVAAGWRLGQTTYKCTYSTASSYKVLVVLETTSWLTIYSISILGQRLTHP